MFSSTTAGSGAGGATSAIALLAAAGLSSRQIADRLVVSIRTIDNHLQRAHRKLGISRREDLGRLVRSVPE